MVSNRNDPSDSPIVRAVTHAVKSQLRWKVWQIRMLFVVSLVLVITASGTGYFVYSNNDNSRTLRQQSITNCQNNNAFRASQVSAWEKYFSLQAQENKATASQLAQLVSVLAHGDPAEIKQIDALLAVGNKANANEVTAFLNFVKAADSPKDCQTLYKPPASDAQNPSALPPDVSTKALVVPDQPAGTPPNTEVIYFQNWDGLCLSVNNSDLVGERLITVPCGSAHGWWYNDLTGYTSPEGHPDTQVGDQGGYLELKAAGQGTDINAHASKVGPYGYTYWSLWFGVQWTYFHADCNGCYVTLTGVPSNALYWAFTGNFAHHGSIAVTPAL